MSNKPELTSPTFKLRVEQILALVEADVRKMRHSPLEILTRTIQPALWLLIFGQAMTRATVIPTGTASYLDFITPGILAQSVLLIGVSYGMSLIWERDMGILHKILASPAPRSALVLGRAIAGGIRGLSQFFMIYLLAFFLDVHLVWNPFFLILAAFMTLLIGATFSTFSLIIASIVKKRERFMGIVQALTMPLFFASNALYPIKLMPFWLQIVSKFNPLTYQVDALRGLMIIGGTATFGLWVDFGISLLALAILVLVATRLYPKILY